MNDLPTGTVTFLYTDIEGSTARWEQQPQAMRVAVARHDALLRQAITAHHGQVFRTAGDGLCAAFATAPAPNPQLRPAENAAPASFREVFMYLPGVRALQPLPLHRGTGIA